MPENGFHPILETRIETLRTRIEGLSSRLFAAEGAERVEEYATVEELEKRRTELADRLHTLEQDAPAGRQGAGEELRAMADDLAGAVEDLVITLDAHHGHQD